MKFFRSNILHTYGFFIILIGVALSTFSFQDDQENHTAFSTWLESQLKSDDAEIQQQLKALGDKTDAFDTILKEASELVKSHTDDFKLPISDKEPSQDDVYTLLLSQWNAYQHSANGMAKAILFEQGKSSVVLPTDGKYFKTIVKDVESSTSSSHKLTEEKADEISAQSYTLSPFKNGHAIGAP